MSNFRRGSSQAGDPECTGKARKDRRLVRYGCMGLPLDRSAAGFLFVSAGGTLANATICRFLRVFLSQMDKVRGGYGQVCPAPRGRLFDLQPRVIRQSSLEGFTAKVQTRRAPDN